MGIQIVQRRELNAACQTNQLLVLVTGSWTSGVRTPWTDRWTGGSLGIVVVLITRRTVVFLVYDIVLVLAEHNVAFLALGDALLDEDLGENGRYGR